MSNKINAIIKLRIDSIENWTISNPILSENELVIVKLSEGKVGLKLGTGNNFNSTGFISFESLNVNSFNNGSSVIELPNKSGTLVVSSDLNADNSEFSEAVMNVLYSNFSNAETTLY